MRPMRINRIVLNGMLAVCYFSLTHCTSSSGSEPGWQEKNEALIAKYNLQEKKLSGLPDVAIASNLEAAKVTSLSSLDSIRLHP